jgi:hypothetical protein
VHRSFESATPPFSAFRLSVAVEDNAERHADEEEEDGDGVDGVAESGIEAALNAVHRLRALPQVVDTDLGSSSATAPATIFAGVIGLRLSSILCQVMTRSCFTDSGNASMGSTLAASRACLLTGECSALHQFQYDIAVASSGLEFGVSTLRAGDSCDRSLGSDRFPVASGADGGSDRQAPEPGDGSKGFSGHEFARAFVVCALTAAALLLLLLLLLLQFGGSGDDSTGDDSTGDGGEGGSATNVPKKRSRWRSGETHSRLGVAGLAPSGRAVSISMLWWSCSKMGSLRGVALEPAVTTARSSGSRPSKLPVRVRS